MSHFCFTTWKGNELTKSCFWSYTYIFMIPVHSICRITLQMNQYHSWNLSHVNVLFVKTVPIPVFVMVKVCIFVLKSWLIRQLTFLSVYSNRKPKSISTISSFLQISEKYSKSYKDLAPEIFFTNTSDWNEQMVYGVF